MNCKKNFIPAFLMLSGMLLLFSSCFKKEDFDFDKFSEDIEVKPTFIFPLLNAKLDFEDIISLSNSDNTKAFLSYTNEGIVIINYMDTIQNTFPIDNPFLKNTILIPVEGDIEISFLSQNKSESFKFFVNNAVFEASAKANATIGDCMMRNLKLYFNNDNGTVAILEAGDVPFSTQNGLFNDILSLDISEDFFRALPTHIAYTFDLEVEVQSIQLPLPEEITMDIAIDVDFPMYGYFGGIDFVHNTDIKMDFNSMPDINDLNITLNFKNNFPFSLIFQIFLMDESGTKVDSLFDTRKTLKAPQIQNEESVGFTIETTDIKYDTERANKLKFVKYAVIDATFNSAGIENEQLVKILKKNQLEIGAIISISEKINTNDLL